MNLFSRLASLACATLLLSFAAEAAASPVSLGARVGGYGFRHAQGSDLEWQDCRMDGVGFFGNIDLPASLYVELSADYYHATGETVAGGMDRIALLGLAGIGVRLFQHFPLQPHFLIGGGVDTSRITVGDDEATRALPVGFVGIGAELVIRRFALGMTLRANAMALPDHDHSGSHSHKHDLVGPDEGIQTRTEVAGQALFTLRYQL